MLIFREFSRHTLIKIYTKTHQTAPHFSNFLGGASINMRANIIHMYFCMKIAIFYSRLY